VITPLYSTSVGTNPNLINLSIIIASLFLFVLGVCFSLMYTRQRINNLTMLSKFKFIEKHYIEPNLYKKNLNELLLQKEEGFLKRGADFYVGLSQIFINSFWFAIFAFFLLKTTIIKINILIILVIVVSLLIFFLQYFIRSQLLRKFEKIR
jgi:hypothetical protein